MGSPVIIIVSKKIAKSQLGRSKKSTETTGVVTTLNQVMPGMV